MLEARGPDTHAMLELPEVVNTEVRYIVFFL